MKNVRGLIVFGLLIFGAVKLVGPSAQTGTNTIRAASVGSAAQPSAEMPSDERRFLAAVASYHNEYSNASTDFQKGVVFQNRANALRASLPSGLEAKGWVGTIYKLSSNGDGFGVLEITLSDDAWLTTWNNSFSDTDDHTLILPTSPVYSTLGDLKEGDKVKVSGLLLPDSGPDVVRTTDLSMGSKMTEPEFLFRFTSIEKL